MGWNSHKNSRAKISGLVERGVVHGYSDTGYQLEGH